MASRSHTAVILALVACTNGSCATHLPAPPSHLLPSIEYHGGRFGASAIRMAYFSAGEVSDRRWERRRRSEAVGYRQCPTGHRILRRDVRWYQPTLLSGQRCAAVVYTFQCTDQDPARADAIEQDRLYLLRMDEDPVAGPDCHDPFAAGGRPRTPSEEEVFAALLSTDATCAEPDQVPAAPIRVFDETRINVDVRVHPSLTHDPGYLFSPRYTPRAAALIGYSFSRAELILPRLRQPAWPPPQIRPPGIADDGRNILVTMDFGLAPSGEPYCVQLTARQGSSIWRRRIVRPGFVEQFREAVGVNRLGMSNDASRYWNPLSDARTLTLALGAELVAHADPVYAQGRPRRRP